MLLPLIGYRAQFGRFFLITFDLERPNWVVAGQMVSAYIGDTTQI